MAETNERDPKMDQAQAGSEEDPKETEVPEKEEEASEEQAAPEDEKKEDADQAQPEEPAEEKDDEGWNEKYMRLMADYQNYRRRTEKEKADVYSYANEKIMTELLTILDNFERALGQECTDESYGKGMELIFKQFQDVLTKSGLKEIEALGKDFDPNFHHAVLTDDNDQYESGQVTAVLQKGYTLNEKVIRPAMVRVNN